MHVKGFGDRNISRDEMLIESLLCHTKKQTMTVMIHSLPVKGFIFLTDLWWTIKCISKMCSL